MTRKEIIKAVCEQIINMLENDVMHEYGVEGFVGWLEDGEVYRLNGMSVEEVDEAMILSRAIADNGLDNITWEYLNIFED